MTNDLPTSVQMQCMRPAQLEAAARAFGTGPGAVRFISGTYTPHVELEKALAAFHGREACMIFSSAYAAVMGVLPPLTTDETAVVSDALNHNCIINATRLGQPGKKSVYPHLDLGALEAALEEAADACRRAIGPAKYHRRTHLTARHVESFCCGINDLVDRLHGEVEGHEFDDRTQSGHRGADADAGEALLGDRRVDHPLLAEFVE